MNILADGIEAFKSVQLDSRAVARELIAEGKRVTPLKPVSKQPDANVWQEGVDESRFGPFSGIGLVLGRLPDGTWIVCADIDSRLGLGAWTGLPSNMVASRETARRSHHFYRIPDDTISDADRGPNGGPKKIKFMLPDGHIEILADGQQVAIPPSFRPPKSEGESVEQWFWEGDGRGEPVVVSWADLKAYCQQIADQFGGSAVTKAPTKRVVKQAKRPAVAPKKAAEPPATLQSLVDTTQRGEGVDCSGWEEWAPAYRSYLRKMVATHLPRSGDGKRGLQSADDRMFEMCLRGLVRYTLPRAVVRAAIDDIVQPLSVAFGDAWTDAQLTHKIDDVCRIRPNHPELGAARRWPDPIPLSGQTPRPAFPADVLPDWMQAFVTAVAEELQVPTDLPAVAALGAAAGGIARKVTVTPWPGWTREPTNLFVMCCLPPGERKSQTFTKVFGPINGVERDAKVAAEPVVKAAESALRVADGRVKHLENKLTKVTTPEDRQLYETDLAAAREDAAKVVVPATPVLRVDDDTPEMMAAELVRQRGRLLAASPEARTLENVSKYSDQPNFDVFLKGHAGDDIRSGRIGRGRDSIDRPALTCVFTPQPGVLSMVGGRGELRDRGFAARWFYALPTSAVGFRAVRPPAMPDAVRRRYDDRLSALWAVGYAADDDRPHDLTFTDDAAAELERFEGWRENQLRPGGTLADLAGWGNKLGGLCVRLAGLLHVADRIGGEWAGVAIDADTVRRAARVCREYAAPHAVAAFEQIGTTAEATSAAALLKWIVGRDQPTADFSKRDALNGCRATFKSVDALDKAIDLLERHYLIRPKVDDPRPGPGRKPSPVYRVNPAARPTESSHNPERGCAESAYCARGCPAQSESDSPEEKRDID